MRFLTIILFLCAALTGCNKGPSKIELPSLISDNMLLQQKSNVAIWGKASPGQKITVSASWHSKGDAVTGKDGKWSVGISTPGAGGPYTIKIEGADTTIVINNVLLGEVWFCSGQSNMEMPLKGWPPTDTVMHSAEAISSSADYKIRLFNVQRKISSVPLDNCTGKWEISSPSAVRPFSATAYFFGRKLYKELKLPIGLIESAWGGTPAESWISYESLKSSGELKSALPEIKNVDSVLIEYSKYLKWLEGHKKLETKQDDGNQWKDLNFNDGNISSNDFNDSAWHTMKLPQRFENIIGDFDGAVWFRKKIEIPKQMTGKDLVLSLGPVDAMDRTYFNGKLIGATETMGFWQSPRNYIVPSSLVKKGENIIAVRVLDTGGDGGIMGENGTLKLTAKNNKSEAVQLEGEWKYRPVAELNSNAFYFFDLLNNDYSDRLRPKVPQAGIPTVLYSGMVCPVIPYRIRGAIWYQGEANVGRADQYAKIFPLMINNWREAWKIKDFPFYFVQIAPYIYSNADSTELAYLREAQNKTLKLANTGMAVTLDIATVRNIHPPYKLEVGERLALLALANSYGMKIECNGPVYKSMTKEKNIIRIQFKNADSGLIARNGKLSEFEIAGADGKYKKAIAKIVDNEVLVSSPFVIDPVSVRYCWRNGAEASLFNGKGLPATQFRTKY